jgi:CBS domain containing-hemolysin-like protein
LTAQDVMTPRVDVQALGAHDSAAEAAGLALVTGLSRFPVFRGSLDEVIGTVHIRDVLALDTAARSRTPVAELVREPLLVPETLPVDRLLVRLRSQSTMAVVIDEYGSTAGVVTAEDVIEEIVGEVRDEHDRDEEPELVPTGLSPDGRTTWEADGGVRLDQLTHMIGLTAPEGPYGTVAGMIATRLERIPAEGDTVHIDGWMLTVLDIDHHRADRVRITAPPPTADDEDGVR